MGTMISINKMSRRRSSLVKGMAGVNTDTLLLEWAHADDSGVQLRRLTTLLALEGHFRKMLDTPWVKCNSVRTGFFEEELDKVEIRIAERELDSVLMNLNAT